MVIHAYSPSMQEAEAGGCKFETNLGLHSELKASLKCLSRPCPPSPPIFLKKLLSICYGHSFLSIGDFGLGLPADTKICRCASLLYLHITYTYPLTYFKPFTDYNA